MSSFFTILSRFFWRLLVAVNILILPFGSALYAHDDGSHKETISIEGAWAPHTGKRSFSAAVYLTIRNIGDELLVLEGVETPAATTAMLHQSIETDGIMSMDHVAELEIPAGGSASLTPGAYHIMLTQLKKPLARGEVFPLTLSFKHVGDVTIMVEITGMGGLE